MRIDTAVEGPGWPCRVVVTGNGDGRIWGKFVLGRCQDDSGRRSLVFDDSAEFHKDIAAGRFSEVFGGGWIEFDQTNRVALVGGKSTQFGREPDRSVTVQLLALALPDYRVEAVE